MMNQPDRMDPDAEPVIENPSAPAMTPPSAGEATAGLSPDGGGTRMSEPAPQGEDEPESDEYPPMEPAGDHPGGMGLEPSEAQAQQEGYLRLVIDVDQGNLELVDVAVVDGPLVHTDLTGLMAYQALVRGRRVAADAFDDLSQQHGFAPPDDPSIGHSITEVAQYQFVARVPLEEVTTEELADMEITLMRPVRTTQLTETGGSRPGLPLEETTVGAGEEPPEIIGRLRGIDLDTSLTPSRAEAVRSRLH